MGERESARAGDGWRLMRGRLRRGFFGSRDGWRMEAVWEAGGVGAVGVAGFVKVGRGRRVDVWMVGMGGVGESKFWALVWLGLAGLLMFSQGKLA